MDKGRVCVFEQSQTKTHEVEQVETLASNPKCCTTIGLLDD
jgi:hypothetical protein